MSFQFDQDTPTSSITIISYGKIAFDIHIWRSILKNTSFVYVMDYLN